jgi:hypothetical protein|tara:strand:- start:2239 stop:2445 length:207 start_codon:yes stop_codon:yes gene_type:complete
MKTNCANCGKKFTCGCQKTVAKNGQTICKSCKNIYNSKRIMVGNGSKSSKKRQLMNTIKKANAKLGRS